VRMTDYVVEPTL